MSTMAGESARLADIAGELRTREEFFDYRISAQGARAPQSTGNPGLSSTGARDGMGDSYQADLSAIRSVIQQMMAASSARDLEAFVSLFTEDVVVMMPDRLPVIGKDAWRASVQGPFDRSTVEQLDMPSEEIVIAGDWAFERHNETVVLVDRENGQRRRAYVKGIWILRRQADGSWKFARYMYNLNPPLEPRSGEHI